MMSFVEYVERNWGIKVPDGDISGAWFHDNGIPMIVRCSCCDMTMASPSAWIDKEGYTYCGSCCEMEEK